MNLDSEQKEVLDYLLNKGSCYSVGPPGTGKTEIFNAAAENWDRSGAILPFTQAARKELTDRLPHGEMEYEGEMMRFPIHGLTVATINSFCAQSLGYWPGSYEEQLKQFLEMEDKEIYPLVGIDEVQDLRPIHFEVVKSVMNGKVFAAGDPNQTIFTFGDALGYQIFEELEDMGLKKFELHLDYRSGKEIVSILNHLYPGDIIAKGPKTYGRTAVFARGHDQLNSISERLQEEDIPHTIRRRNGKDIRIHGGDSLFLMVTHACKGLGFDRVFQFDWRVPNKPDTNWQEEFNLMYVSVARASKEFYLVEGTTNTNCWQYLRGSKARFIVMSELIKELKKDTGCATVLSHE